jgi:hypothetical protein
MSILLAGGKHGDRKRGVLSLQSRRRGGEPVIGSDSGSSRQRILAFRHRYVWSSPLTTAIRTEDRAPPHE